MLEVVCGVIEAGDGRVLACRRGPGMAMAGLWEFPGGKRERGEDARSALARELREELGIEVVTGEPLRPVEHAYPGFTILLLPFLCRMAGGEFVAREHDRLRWLMAAELDEVAWAPADVPVVEEWRRLRSRGERAEP